VDDLLLETGPLPPFAAVESFEDAAALERWTAGQGVWGIGVPVTGPATNALGQRAHGGTNCLVTLLAGKYYDNTRSQISSPRFTVPSASENPRLRFWHWWSFSYGDLGQVMISTNNGATWQALSENYGEAGSGMNYWSSGEWTRAWLDLTPFAGLTVQLGFLFYASDAVNGDDTDAGWYVDDLLLETGPLPPFAAVEGFEDAAALERWRADHGVWGIGVPVAGPATNALGQRAHGGTNCLVTLLAGKYYDNTWSRISSPRFTVPSASENPRLRFWHWWSFHYGDLGLVQISTNNGATWQALSENYGEAGTGFNYWSSGEWTRTWLDLTPFAGLTVQLGFLFYASDAVNGDDTDAGWYVDDLLLETGPLPPFAAVESFEDAAALERWTAGQGVWGIGVPVTGPATNALGQRAHGGTNCLVTLLAGKYYDNTRSQISSPRFTVPSASENPRLRFWHWWSFSYGDLGQVMISTNNGATWQALSENYGEAGSGMNYWSSGEWTRAWLDLTPFAGLTVQLGFLFYASDAVNGDDTDAGWYVDDLLLETGPLPQFAAVEGFEDAAALERWRADHGVWGIGVPVAGPATNALGQRAHGGTNCLVTLLAGKYYDNTWSRISSPRFTVPPVGEHPLLRFWHWFSFSAGDSGELQIRAGNSDWVRLAGWSGSTGGIWSRTPPVDLSPFSGQTVQLGFLFYASDAVNGDDTDAGWYIDDITLTSANPPTGIVEFMEGRYYAREDATNAIITVNRKHGTNGSVCVDVMASDGSAISGEDFDAVVDTLCWADGEGGAKSFSVSITPDTSAEGNESVSLTLSVPGAYDAVVARKSAALIIIDDDVPQPLITNIAYLRSLVNTTDYVATNTTSLFTVEGTVTTCANLSLALADELFFMQDGANGIAVLFRGGTNQFMPQAGDRLRITASLTNINGLLALAPDYANITNVVWRLGSGYSLPTPASLDFATGTDVPLMEAMEARYLSMTNVFISQSGGAYFPSVLTNILVTNQGGLTFNMTMHPNLTNAGQLKPVGPVTILGVLTQNDPTVPYTTNYAVLPTEIVSGEQPVIQFISTSFTILESGPTVILSVSRTGGNSGPATVSYGTENGTAVSGADFVATNGVLSWADGETGTKTLNVSFVNDSAEEADEVFTLGLSGVALGTNTTALITIVNDDFIARPAWQALPLGTNATISVLPTPNALAFQWWKDGAAKANATGTALTVTNLQPTDGGNYWAVVTTSAGAVTSSVAQLVIAVPPQINAQPASQTVQAGSYVSFTVGVSGTEPFTYQWRRGGQILDGATSASLVLPSAQPSDNGDYSVVVNNPANQPVISASAALLVFGGGFVPTNAGIGSVTISNGCYVVSGSGEDIEGTEDRFFFVFTPLSGDGQIIAQLGNLAPDNPLSEAGIMLRDGFAGGDRHVFLALNAEKRSVFRRRLNANYDSVETWHRGTNSAWLRLMRMGDTFSGHYSTNGLNWELVWWTTMTDSPTTLQAGLAVTAHRHTGMATATLCNVSVGGLVPLSGWTESGPRIYLGGELRALEFERVGGFKALVVGTPGERLAIWSGGDVAAPFASWLSLGTVTNTYGVVPFLDSHALTNKTRFYRLQRLEQ
jgi:hypothetical protein